MYGNGIKAFIIESIADKVFLNAKQIIFLVQENFDTSNSEKTIYRHLKDLVKDNILFKYGECYKFTTYYISKINNLNNKIQKNIFSIQHSQEILKDIDKNGHIEKTFDSLIEHENFTQEFARLFTLDRNKNLEEIIFIYNWIYIFTSQGKEIIKNIKYNNYSIKGLISGNNIPNKIVVDKLKNLDYNIKLTLIENIFEDNTEYIIRNDYIQSTKFSKKYMDKIKNLMLECKKGEIESKIKMFINGKNMNEKIYMKIEKNKKRANMIQKLIEKNL